MTDKYTLCRFCCNRATTAIQTPQLVYLCDEHLEASKEKSIKEEYINGKKVKA
ncbi:MAG: hypothetical protein NE328_19185 [Lentisphaeraceae bacterium]|nr:hypothetical protein [Lentisphaeraceae bacterium]